MEQHSASDAASRALVRSRMYGLLAKSFLYPTETVFRYIRSSAYDGILADYGALHETGAIPRSDEFRREDLESEYNRLFAHIGSAKCPPYESEYGYDNIFQKTQAMADIAGFYRAYGLEPADTRTERVDFIGTEFEFMSFLLMSENYGRSHEVPEQCEVALDTQKKFLRDHLGRWMEVFSLILLRNAEGPFYRSLGGVAQEFVESELALLGVIPERVPLRTRPHGEPLEAFGCNDCMASSPVVPSPSPPPREA